MHNILIMPNTTPIETAKIWGNFPRLWERCKFSSKVYKNKAERIFFWICFCSAIAYARSLMFMLILCRCLCRTLRWISLFCFTLCFLLCRLIWIWKDWCFYAHCSVHDLNNHLNHLTKIHNFSCRPIRKRVYTRLSNLIVQLMRLFVRFR